MEKEIVGSIIVASAFVLPILTALIMVNHWRPLAAEGNAVYDIDEELDLSALEPLIALPSSPGNVVPVREVEGQEIYQAYIGSSANPGYRDAAVVAAMVAGRRIASGVSLDINPASRQALGQLIREGGLARLIEAGARLHETGCNGCLGMGQAPAAGRRSLRTVTRNFPGRSGTKEDQVYLCSPETAAASGCGRRRAGNARNSGAAGATRMRTRFLLRSATRIVAVVGVGCSYGPTARTVALTSIPSFLICSAVAPAAFAQSGGTGGMALDGRPHPGSPITGWTGNISPADPYSAGPNMGAWITKAGLIHSRSEVGVGELNGKMYVLGGYADGNVAQPLNEEYDPVRDMWRERAPLPQGANHIAVVGLEGKLYAIGGFVERWSDSVPLPFPREHFNLIVLSGKLYAIGGRMENFSQNTQTIFSLDLHDQGARWTALPLMPIARSGTQAAVLDNKIFVFGGEGFGGVFNSTEMFDPATQRWSELTPMPVGRHGTGAVTLGNMIYIPAGGPSTAAKHRRTRTMHSRIHRFVCGQCRRFVPVRFAERE
jgi:hypothetical protein